MAELKPFEVIMRLYPIAGQNGKGEVCMKAERVSELIRCKDCLMHGVCRFEQGLGLDGYCSQAERRESDGTRKSCNIPS